MNNTSENFIDTFDKKYDFTSKMAISFFENHNLKQFKERTEFIYLGDLNNIRQLAHTLMIFFEFRSDFIRFYEDIFKHREVPHYEDAIILYSLIISTIAAFGTLISPIIGEEYKYRKRKNEKEKKEKIDSDLILDEFEYFIKAYALRDAFYTREITNDEFFKLKEHLFNNIFLKTNEKNEVLDSQIKQIWKKFDRNSQIPFKEELIKELDTIAKSTKNESIITMPIQKVPLSSNKLSGLGASPGSSIGILKVYKKFGDDKKVENGDIVFFEDFHPDSVSALLKSSAAIGGPMCGGLTGHLAIVSRGLGIPCVTQIDFNDFGDGQIVFVDGGTGEIRIYTNKEDILNGLNIMK